MYNKKLFTHSLNEHSIQHCSLHSLPYKRQSISAKFISNKISQHNLNSQHTIRPSLLTVSAYKTVQVPVGWTNEILLPSGLVCACLYATIIYSRPILSETVDCMHCTHTDSQKYEKQGRRSRGYFSGAPKLVSRKGAPQLKLIFSFAFLGYIFTLFLFLSLSIALPGLNG